MWRRDGQKVLLSTILIYLSILSICLICGEEREWESMWLFTTFIYVYLSILFTCLIPEEESEGEWKCLTYLNLKEWESVCCYLLSLSIYLSILSICQSLTWRIEWERVKVSVLSTYLLFTIWGEWVFICCFYLYFIYLPSITIKVRVSEGDSGFRLLVFIYYLRKVILSEGEFFIYYFIFLLILSTYHYLVPEKESGEIEWMCVFSSPLSTLSYFSIYLYKV